ncbi:hypothetical protein DL96DRAFT_1560048 [Flagelloscypha sp. PMI_526]|nr:hypothetical protein DL96DRAFT_1560048 [Flagelloscypha sp. PMI_526]
MSKWAPLAFLFSLLLLFFVDAKQTEPSEGGMRDTDPRITYSPLQAWSPGQQCGAPNHAKCLVDRLPVTEYTVDKTWHYGYFNASNGTEPLSAEVNFTGIEIRVYGVHTRGARFIPQILNFFVDGKLAGNYTMPMLNGTEDSKYFVRFFNATVGRKNENHTIRVETQNVNESLIMIDQFVYVELIEPHDDSTAGMYNAFVTGMVFAGLIGFLVIFSRRKARARVPQPTVDVADERTLPGSVTTLVEAYPMSKQ